MERDKALRATLFGLGVFLITAANLPTSSQTEGLPTHLRGGVMAVEAIEGVLVDLGRALSYVPLQGWLRRHLGLEFSWTPFAPTPPVVVGYVDFVAQEGERQQLLWTSRPLKPFTVQPNWRPLNKLEVLLTFPSQKDLRYGLADYLLMHYQRNTGHLPEALRVEVEFKDIMLDGSPRVPARYTLANYQTRKP